MKRRVSMEMDKTLTAKMRIAVRIAVGVKISAMMILINYPL